MNLRRTAALLALLMGVLVGCQTKSDLTTSGTKVPTSKATHASVAAATTVTTVAPSTTVAPVVTVPAPPPTDPTPRTTMPTIPTGDGCGSYVNSNGNTICVHRAVPD